MAWLGILVRGLFARVALLFGFLANAWLVMASSQAVVWLVRAAVIVAIILWLPLPSWLTGLPSLLSSMPSGVTWLLDVCEFKTGLGIVLGAYVLRIILRMSLRVVS